MIHPYLQSLTHKHTHTYTHPQRMFWETPAPRQDRDRAPWCPPPRDRVPVPSISMENLNLEKGTPRGSREPQDALCNPAASTPEEGSESEGSQRRQTGREGRPHPLMSGPLSPRDPLVTLAGIPLVAWGGLCRNLRALIREGSQWSAPADHLRAQGADVEILSSADETVQGLRLKSAGRVDRAAGDLKRDMHAERGHTVHVSAEKTSRGQWPLEPRVRGESRVLGGERGSPKGTLNARL